MRVCFRLAAIWVVVVLALTACSMRAGGAGPAATPGAAASATTGTAGTQPLPEYPVPAPAATDTPRGHQGGGQRPSPSAKSTGSPWGSYANRQEACVGVAANVAVLLLAPLSFLADVDEKELADLEAQVAKTRNRVPAALKGDFAHLEKVLAKNNDEEEFDDEAFLKAMQPIRDWLAANCSS